MKIKKINVILFFLILTIFIILITTFFFGILQFNYPSKKIYPITGIDVSSYQGDINWEIIANEDISFAIIKATEGSNYIDEKFLYNFDNATKTKLKIGFYHFFSFETSGFDQAKHFINTVPIITKGIPPVIDIELYGDFKIYPPEKNKVILELNNMINELKKHYGVTPILYVTKESYNLYIEKNFSNPIWARSVYSPINYMNSREWIFWQYSNRKKLKGYSGEEIYIDMNCFNGNEEEFENYINNN